MRLRGRDHCTWSTLIGRKGWASPSSFTLRLRDQRSMWMQNGCIVYMDIYMALNGSCFMVTWIIFKNHLLEVGLTQNQGTPNAHNCWFILFYYVWGPARIEIHWNSIWLRSRSRMTSHYKWGSVITLFLHTKFKLKVLRCVGIHFQTLTTNMQNFINIVA